MILENKLDGTEDELFRWPSDNKEHSMVEDLKELEDHLKDDNNILTEK